MERVGYAGGTLSWALWFFITHFVAVLCVSAKKRSKWARLSVEMRKGTVFKICFWSPVSRSICGWFPSYFSSCKYRLQPIGGSCLVAYACAGENQSSLTYRLIKLKTNCFSIQLCECKNDFAGAREMGLVLEWGLIWVQGNLQCDCVKVQ